MHVLPPFPLSRTLFPAFQLKISRHKEMQPVEAVPLLQLFAAPLSEAPADFHTLPTPFVSEPPPLLPLDFMDQLSFAMSSPSPVPQPTPEHPPTATPVYLGGRSSTQEHGSALTIPLQACSPEIEEILAEEEHDP